jgi:hypothetical protein
MKQFITEHLEKFIAPDGGGKLDVSDEGGPLHGCTLNRTINQNGILYLVHPAFEFVSEYPEFKPQYKEAYERHMASTEIESGCHSRICGDRFLIRQSHDNVLAMLIGGWLFDSVYAKRVFDFLKAHNFCYNVADPNAYDVRCQLQGGDMAIAYYATRQAAPLWCVIWLALGLAFTRKWNLADLRISFLKENVFKTIPKKESLILSAGMLLHGIRRGKRSTKYRLFDFSEFHPFVKFLEARS